MFKFVIRYKKQEVINILKKHGYHVREINIVDKHGLRLIADKNESRLKLIEMRVEKYYIENYNGTRATTIFYYEEFFKTVVEPYLASSVLENIINETLEKI